MAIQLTGRTMSSDLTAIAAICVGDEQWVVQQLRGRTLTTGQALAAIRLAETLPGPRPDDDDDPLWPEIFCWLDALGMSHAPLAVAGELGVACQLTPLPETRTRHLPNRRRFARWTR